MSLKAGFFTHDGLRFRTFEAGRGAPIVFLHGGGSRASNFHQVMERLAPQFHVIAFDLRGFGETGADMDRPITHQIWAEDVGACLDYFGIAKANLVGWSLGATIALNFASQFGAHVERMALLGAPHPDRPTNRALFEKRLNIIAGGGTAADVVAATFEGIAHALRPWVHQHRPEALEQVRQEHLSHEVKLAAKVVDGYTTRPDLNALLPKVQCPVMLIVGDADRTCDLAGAQELQRRLAHATVKIVPDCGHYYGVEQPDSVARAIAEAFGAPNV